VKCSGDMWVGVPNCPAGCAEPNRFPPGDGPERPTVPCLTLSGPETPFATPGIAAKPRSVILTALSWPIIMLAGLMSRWQRIPLE
jgi:hypothetical protein